ncbi:MAG TPA: GNAT family N-acetyltransferase [Gaiellaceae bacterium]|jgi:GNAT superfamily N-acetyltransferase|nr:GNAT family N-acetyltransferase [Gaiellaceae bacterium]
MLRAADQQDTRFLRDMLRHAYHWRMGDPDLPVFRYVKNWGRPGDAGVIASAGPNAYGAAWYRLFPADAPGFAFVDEQTPEVTIAVVPSHRGKGTGGELLEALLERARAEGFAQISLSAEPGQTGFYEKHGFRELRREDGTVTMVASL